MRKLILGLLCLVGQTCRAEEHTVPQIGYPQGLSNSAVFTLCRDDMGFLWLGTYDGLNAYDGRSMNTYRTDSPTGKPLLSNIILNIAPAGNHCLWVSTASGLNRFSAKTHQVIESYNLNCDYYKLFSNKKGDTWLLYKNDLSYYNTALHRFVKVETLHRRYDKGLSFTDTQGRLWLLAKGENVITRFSLSSFDHVAAHPQVLRMRFHNRPIIYTCVQGDRLCFIDSNDDLFVYGLNDNTKIFIRNIRILRAKYGDVKGISIFYDDIFIGFLQNGLVRLDSSHHYNDETVNRNIRIYTLYKDPNQDILWMGTDGLGVMAYSQQQGMASQMLFSDIGDKISRPVRSFLTDARGNLWIGTKGDGLVRVANFHPASETHPFAGKTITVYSPGQRNDISAYNRSFKEYQIMSLAASRQYNGFWIGAGNGLGYYDYGRDAIVTVKGAERFGLVHGIYEENRNTVWIATGSGNGVVKLQIEKQGNEMKMKKFWRYRFPVGHNLIRDFYPMVVEGNSVMWLGSRGNGLVKFYFHKGIYRIYHLGGSPTSAQNDILSLYRDGHTIYAGTIAGLVTLTFGTNGQPTITQTGKREGFQNDMIHGVLKARDGYLWLSTNKGLVKYDPHSHIFHTYYYTRGLQIGEFCDDAYYRDPRSGLLYFGAINGLLCLNHDHQAESAFNPSLYFNNLTINGEHADMNTHFDANKELLTLNGREATFSISFSVPDFIDTDDYEFSYRMEDYQDAWTPFRSNETATFSSLPHGNYILQVRYKKDVFNSLYETAELNICILPPWYLTWWAKMLYVLLTMTLGYCIYIFSRRYYRKGKVLRELMFHESHRADRNTIDRQRHEATTLLTAIYHKCAELTRYDSMPDKFYRDINDINDKTLAIAFEFGEGWEDKIDIWSVLPQQVTVEHTIRLKEINDEVISLLIGHHVDNLSNIKTTLDEDQQVALPRNPLHYLLYYVYLTCAVSKTTTSISYHTEGRNLLTTVTAPTDTLAQLMTDSSARKDKTVERDFKAYITNQLYAYALHIMGGQMNLQNGSLCITLPMQQVAAPTHNDSGDSNRKSALLLEADQEMSNLIHDILQKDYDLTTVKTTQAAFNYLRRYTPDVFIADMLGYMNNEEKLLEYIRTNAGLLMKTAFMPLTSGSIFLKMKDEYATLIDSFVILPYCILFLKEYVNIAIERKVIKDQASLNDFTDEKVGNVICKTKEQATFIKQLLQIVDKNLAMDDMNILFIADNMNMSTRQFYRRFKEISITSPAVFIKNHRIEKAAELLRSTDLSIQEIINAVGIQSRAYFYKEFTARYGETPKSYQRLKSDNNGHTNL